MRAAGERRAIWLIRHAESEWNALGRWQGQRDPALSARGREQAERLAASLGELALDGIVASDLRRARETAGALGRRRGVEPCWDARLRERDLGAWAGLTTAEIAARWPEELRRLRAHDLDLRPGGGESMRQLRARVGGFVAELCRWPGSGPIAIVTHAGVLRVLGFAPAPGNAELRSATLGALRAALAHEEPRPGAGEERV